jgi:hypothetical protein
MVRTLAGPRISAAWNDRRRAAPNQRPSHLHHGVIWHRQSERATYAFALGDIMSIIGVGQGATSHAAGPRPNLAENPQRVTIQSASATIDLEIFDSPCSRSRNVMGASATSKPARSARITSSIWNT